MDNEQLKQAMEKEKKRLELESKRRRQVFETIVELTDPVSEETLLKNLNLLDSNSWNEVIEERYLGKLCGFPLCPKNVIVQTKQKYRIDRKMKKVYETSSLRQKFCSEKCFLQSKAIQDQLYQEPLWLTGDRPYKKYEIIPVPSDKYNETEASCSDEFEIVTQSIVTRLHDLKIAEHAKSDNENEEDLETDFDEKKASKEENENFVHAIKSFISTKSGAIMKKESCKIEKKTELPANRIDDRLAKIIEKCGKKPREKRAPPPIIEAQPINAICLNKQTSHADDFTKIFKSWISPTTVRLVKKSDSPDSELELTFTELVKQFYAGDSMSVENKKRKQKEEELKAMRFPLVDNIDQHFRRVEILFSSLKSSWSKMITCLEVDFSLENTKNLLSSFTLNSENCILSRDDKPFATAAIFELICYNEMNEWISKDTNRDRYQKYIESMGLPNDYFRRLIAECMGEIGGSGLHEENS